MVFASLTFVVFDVVVFCLSWVLRCRRTNFWEAEFGS